MHTNCWSHCTSGSQWNKSHSNYRFIMVPSFEGSCQSMNEHWGCTMFDVCGLRHSSAAKPSLFNLCGAKNLNVSIDQCFESWKVSS